MGPCEPCCSGGAQGPAAASPGAAQTDRSSTSYDPKQGPTHLGEGHSRGLRTWVHSKPCCSGGAQGPACRKPGTPSRPGRAPRMTRSRAPRTSTMRQATAGASTHGSIRAMLQRGRARPGRREPGGPRARHGRAPRDDPDTRPHAPRDGGHSRASTHGSIRAMLQRGRARPGRREPGGPQTDRSSTSDDPKQGPTHLERGSQQGLRHMGPCEPCSSGGAQGPAAASPGAPQTDRSSTSDDPKQGPTHLESGSCTATMHGPLRAMRQQVAHDPAAARQQHPLPCSALADSVPHTHAE